MVKGGGVDGFGGGWLEQSRRWLGAQWAGLFLGVPSCAEPPGVPRGGTGAELGRCPDCSLYTVSPDCPDCQGGHFDHDLSARDDRRRAAREARGEARLLRVRVRVGVGVRVRG